MNDQFYEGLDVYYQKQFSLVQFIFYNYIVVCIAQGDSKLNYVCLIVYPENYQYITLFKQSQK